MKKLFTLLIAMMGYMLHAQIIYPSLPNVDADRLADSIVSYDDSDNRISRRVIVRTQNATETIYQTTLSYEFSDEGESIWFPVSRTTVHLNQKEQTTLSKGEMWDILSNSWRLTTQSEYTYDNDLLSIVQTQLFNGASGLLETKFIDTYTYNDQKQLILQLNNTYKPQLLSQQDETTYTYNPDGTLKTELERTRTTEKDPWVNAEYSTYLYNGLHFQLIHSIWKDNAWKENIKSETTLDNLKRISEISNFEWVNNQWEQTEKIQYNYGNNGITEYRMDNYEKGILSSQYWSLYEYNQEGRLYLVWNKQKEATDEEWTTLKDQYFYDAATKIPRLPESRLSIWQDAPGSLLIQASCARKIAIHDLSGRQISQIQLNGDQPSQVLLSPGCYLIQGQKVMVTFP